MTTTVIFPPFSAVPSVLSRFHDNTIGNLQLKNRLNNPQTNQPPTNKLLFSSKRKKNRERERNRRLLSRSRSDGWWLFLFPSLVSFGFFLFSSPLLSSPCSSQFYSRIWSSSCYLFLFIINPVQSCCFLSFFYKNNWFVVWERKKKREREREMEQWLGNNDEGDKGGHEQWSTRK
jgi:hypothetical protein